MAKVILPAICLFLLIPAISKAQTPIVQMATENKVAPPQCVQFRTTVIAELAKITDKPSWRIVVTCDDAMWKYLRQRNRAERTDTAFTNPKASDGRALTVLHGGEWSTVAALRETLLHELEHIRCNCSLGE